MNVRVAGHRAQQRDRPAPGVRAVSSARVRSRRRSGGGRRTRCAICGADDGGAGGGRAAGPEPRAELLEQRLGEEVVRRRVRQPDQLSRSSAIATVASVAAHGRRRARRSPASAGQLDAGRAQRAHATAGRPRARGACSRRCRRGSPSHGRSRARQLSLHVDRRLVARGGRAAVGVEDRGSVGDQPTGDGVIPARRRAWRRAAGRWRRPGAVGAVDRTWPSRTSGRRRRAGTGSRCRSQPSVWPVPEQRRRQPGIRSEQRQRRRRRVELLDRSRQPRACGAVGVQRRAGRQVDDVRAAVGARLPHAGGQGPVERASRGARGGRRGWAGSAIRRRRRRLPGPRPAARSAPAGRRAWWSRRRIGALKPVSAARKLRSLPGISPESDGPRRRPRAGPRVARSAPPDQ